MARHWSRTDARKAIAAWQESGEGRAAFCRSQGWSATRLDHWLRPASSALASIAPSFIEVRETVAEPVVAPLRIEVGRAAIVVAAGFDPQLLRAVVEALA